MGRSSWKADRSVEEATAPPGGGRRRDSVTDGVFFVGTRPDDRMFVEYAGDVGVDEPDNAYRPAVGDQGAYVNADSVEQADRALPPAAALAERSSPIPKGETMFNRKKHHDTTRSDTHVVKGAGLARGPALILGSILAAAGLVLFLHAGATPTGGFPDGDARGEKFLGFESNGWTAFFTTTAGVILLFAAAQHLLAKLLGLGVGLALAACVVLDLVNGPGVLGLAAANWAVDLGWAIAAVLLLLNVFAPRIKHEAPAEPRHGRLHDDTPTRSSGTVRPVTAAETADRHHDGDHGRDDDRGLVGDHRHVDERTATGTVGDPSRRDATDGSVPRDASPRDPDAPASTGPTRFER